MTLSSGARAGEEVSAETLVDRLQIHTTVAAAGARLRCDLRPGDRVAPRTRGAL